MRDHVVISLEPWDSVWRRNQHLVAGLLRTGQERRFLFVEPAADPTHALSRGHVPRRGRGLRPGPALGGVGAGRLWLHQPTKLLPRRLDPRADERVARSIVRAALRLGLEQPALWVNDPNGVRVLEATAWPALYDITDDWTRAERPAAETARLVAYERTLLERCQHVVVCSPDLARSKGASRPVTLVPNAVDIDAYRVLHPRPDDLPPARVAMYVGTVHRDRIDVDLVVRTARSLPAEARLVLVGPAPLDPEDRSRLVAAGVALLGPRPFELIPAYLQHADVLLVPHVVTPFTESLDPIKLYEYRAAGRSVVSTPVAGFRDSDDPHIHVADEASFAAEVARRVAASPLGRQESPARDVPSWADRVVAFAEVLDQLTQ